MGLCSGAEREFACPANGPTTTGTIMAKIDLRSRGRFAIFRRYEWASVVCRKAQVVQSLPHHAEYGRSGDSVQYIFAILDATNGPL